MRAIALTGLVLVCACGEDRGLAPLDAPDIDGAVDAPIDATIDCCIIEPPPRVSGRILLFEVDLLDPASDASFGQGLLGEAAFFDDVSPQPVYETNPGTVFGCKVWVLDRMQAIAARGYDEGTVALELPGLEPPQVSTCSFAASTGYACAGATAVTAGLADPGTMPDLQPVAVRLTAGGANQVSSFTATGADVGDDFSLPPADLARLENIPRDGSAFTLGCDPATCPPTAAPVNELEIVTTDAPTADLSPFAMPLPTSRSVVIRCAEIGAPILSVSATVAAHLLSSNATRIQATYRRGRLASPTPAGVMAIAGHAIRGISN